MLAASPLALGALDRDPGRGQRPSGGTDVPLDAGSLQQVVVLDVPAGGFEIGVPLAMSVAVGVVEEEELQLRCRHDSKPSAAARSTWVASIDRGATATGACVCDVDDVAQHDRRRVGPPGAVERGEVGDQVEVAVAEFPTGVVVSGDGFHLHVDRQQVVAGMGSVADRVVEEEGGVDALAEQTAIAVGERGQHRVDLAGADQGAEIVGSHGATGQ